MQQLLTRKNGKKPLKIDFTKGGNFKEFNNVLKKYLIKNKKCKSIQITDYIYPLSKLSKLKGEIHQIKDHINLSVNPLKGPSFIPMNNVYSSKAGIVIAGLKNGVRLNNKEKKILLKAGVKAYCYNAVPTVIFATSLGFLPTALLAHSSLVGLCKVLTVCHLSRHSDFTE